MSCLNPPKSIFASTCVNTPYFDSVQHRFFIFAVTEMGGATHAAIKAAVGEFNSKTCIRVKERTTEKDYINFFKGSGYVIISFCVLFRSTFLNNIRYSFWKSYISKVQGKKHLFFRWIAAFFLFSWQLFFK